MNDLIEYVPVHEPEHYRPESLDIPNMKCCGPVMKYVHTGPGLDTEDLHEVFYSCINCQTIWIPVTEANYGYRYGE